MVGNFTFVMLFVALYGYVFQLNSSVHRWWRPTVATPWPCGRIAYISDTKLQALAIVLDAQTTIHSMLSLAAKRLLQQAG